MSDVFELAERLAMMHRALNGRSLLLGMTDTLAEVAGAKEPGTAGLHFTLDEHGDEKDPPLPVMDTLFMLRNHPEGVRPDTSLNTRNYLTMPLFEAHIPGVGSCQTIMYFPPTLEVTPTALVEAARHATVQQLLLKPFENYRLQRINTRLGLPNEISVRDAFDDVQQFNPETTIEARHNYLLFCDLDRLKEVNDNEGHGAGDRLIRLVGYGINQFRIDPTNTHLFVRAGHIAGDEFSIVVGNATKKEVEKLVTGMQQLVQSQFLQYKTGERIPVNVTAGVTRIREQDGYDRARERADNEMYRMKPTRRSSNILLSEYQASNADEDNRRILGRE